MTEKANIYAVILAGGSGTRFWPASRQDYPKQFLNVTGNRSLLQETLWRVIYKINSSNIYIVTNKEYKKEVLKQTKDFRIPKENILLEPEGKNTAPAILWAASVIYAENENATLAVLPSDHLIMENKAYIDCLTRAIELAQEDYLVTFGIIPTRPETGYGYLKTRKAKLKGGRVLQVEEFVEKPNLKTAQEYVKKKNYLWNSGMFVFKCETILEEFAEHLPKMYKYFEDCVDDAHVNKIWRKLPSISIDYGIMEKSGRVLAVAAKDIGWSDLGSFESLMDVLPPDAKGNVFKGDVISLNTSGTLVWGDRRLIAAVGLENLAVIDTPDALLICPVTQSQKVRDVFEILKKKKRKEYLSAKKKPK